jgi:hypothetical protein
VLPGETTTSSVSVPPRPSLTRTRTVTEPGELYVLVLVAPPPSSKTPSPSSAHSKVSGSSSASVEPPASKSTVRGAAPDVGSAVSAATGAWLLGVYLIRWTPPAPGTTAPSTIP